MINAIKKVERVDMRTLRRAYREREHFLIVARAKGLHTKISLTILPLTSVKRKSRPWNLYVSFL